MRSRIELRAEPAEYPGVREAVEELGLRGEPVGGRFLWRKPPG